VNRLAGMLLTVATVFALAAGAASAARAEATDTLKARLAPHPPANVNIFAGDKAARVDLCVTDPGPKARTLSAAWTLTDIDGATVEGVATVSTRPGEEVVVPLELGAEAFGPYTLTVLLKNGDRALATCETRLARIRPLPDEPNPDSPFALWLHGDLRVPGLGRSWPSNLTVTVQDEQTGADDFARTSRRAWNRAKARDACGPAVAWARRVEDLGALADQGAAPATDAAAVRRLPVLPVAYVGAVFPAEPEGKLTAVRTLLESRDEHFPGKPAWTADGWWQAEDPLGPAGARVLPRVVLSQLVAGVDRVFWDGTEHDGRPGVPLLDPNLEPTPAYAAWATMVHVLDGARYVGPTGVNPRIQQHWFVRGNDVILAAWYVGGEQRVTFSSSLNRVEVTDHVGRRRLIEPRHGRFDLVLTPDVQYLQFPRESERYGAAGIRMLEWMEELRVFDVDALPPAIEQAAGEAHADNRAMTRLHDLVRLAEQIAHKGEAPKPMGDVPSAEEAVREARRAVEEKEGEDGYLRRARVALGWTERLVREAKRQGPIYGPPVAWAVRLSATATRLIADREEPYCLEADAPGKPGG